MKRNGLAACKYPPDKWEINTANASKNDPWLIVGGNLVIGAQPVNGNIVYGGTFQGPARWYNYALRHVEPVTVDSLGNVPADGSGRTAADLLEAVRELSEKVTALEDFGTVTNNADGCLVLVGTNAVRNVFSVTAEQWSGSQRDWIFDVPTGSKIAVNVRGAVVEFSAGSCVATVINGVVSNETAANSAPPAPVAKADYGVTEMWFSCVPTFAGKTFTVNVRVANAGDADGEGAILGLYLVNTDHDATIASTEKDTAVRTVELGRIPAGQSRVYSFGGLTVPDTNGVCRVIAYADIEEVQSEYSKGDNQNNLTYELSQVNLRINVSAEGVTLTWSNGWGQKYSILGSNDLEYWDDVVTDIPSARDESGLVENTYTVGFDTGYNFFKLRVDQR